jgi:hypothetical protein
LAISRQNAEDVTNIISASLVIIGPALLEEIDD